jgi:hypothetical protein
MGEVGPILLTPQTVILKEAFVVSFRTKKDKNTWGIQCFEYSAFRHIRTECNSKEFKDASHKCLYE